MPASVHAALVISIVASALGALVMCLLVARYGLTPAEDSDGATQRLIVTRFGHAVAGVCFAATGIMAVVALAAPRPAPPTPSVVATQPDRAAEARLQALAADIKGLAARLDQRLDQLDGRVGAVDGSARHLGDELASLSQRARQMERAMVPPPRRAAVPEPAPKPQTHEIAREPVVAKDSPRVSERFVPAPPAPVRADVPAAAPPPLPQASDPAAAVRTPPPAARAPERTTAPVVRAPEPTPAPRSLPTAARAPDAATSRPLPAAEPAPARGADGRAAAAKADEDLGDKFREDWKTIRGGFSTAADDFKSAVRDLGRKLWR